AHERARAYAQGPAPWAAEVLLAAVEQRGDLVHQGGLRGGPGPGLGGRVDQGPALLRQPDHQGEADREEGPGRRLEASRRRDEARRRGRRERPRVPAARRQEVPRGAGPLPEERDGPSGLV